MAEALLNTGGAQEMALWDKKVYLLPGMNQMVAKFLSQFQIFLTKIMEPSSANIPLRVLPSPREGWFLCYPDRPV